MIINKFLSLLCCVQMERMTALLRASATSLANQTMVCLFDRKRPLTEVSTVANSCRTSQSRLKPSKTTRTTKSKKKSIRDDCYIEQHLHCIYMHYLTLCMRSLHVLNNLLYSLFNYFTIIVCTVSLNRHSLLTVTIVIDCWYC